MIKPSAFYNFNQSNSRIWSKPLSVLRLRLLESFIGFNSITWLLLLYFLFRFLNYCMEAHTIQTTLTDRKFHIIDVWKLITESLRQSWGFFHIRFNGMLGFSFLCLISDWESPDWKSPEIHMKYTGLLVLTNNYELLELSGYCWLV